MRKLLSALPPLLACASFAMPAAATAAGTITVDRTIEQTCTYGIPAPGRTLETLSLPIRLQFTVPETLQAGEPLVIDQRRVSLSSLADLYATIARTKPSSGLRASFGGGGPYSGPTVGVTGVADPIRIGTRLGASWITGTPGPAEIAAPDDGTFGPALPGIDVPRGAVNVTYTGFDASVALQIYDLVYGYPVTCKPAAPVVLATVQVSEQPGPPAVDALSDLQSPPAGGATIRIQGRNLTGADAVSFGGTPATSFSVVRDGVIDAVVPAHTAAPDVQVQVRRGSASSADTEADDFDYVGAPAPGRFDVQVALTCTEDRVPPRVRTVGLRLRGKVPTSVEPGSTFAATDLHATLLFDGETMTDDLGRARYAEGSLGPVEIGLQGATAPTGKLGDGYFDSTSRRVISGEPVAFEGDFDGVWSSPVPPNTITAAAPASGEVVLSFGEPRPGIFAVYGGGASASGPRFSGCSVVPSSGDGVIARVPVGAPAVDQRPVVNKVSAIAFAKIGGIVSISGQRLAGAKVKIGGRSAARIATVGSTVFVSAPALPAGVYDVVVTTSAGTSLVTAKSKVLYRPLF